MKVSMRVVEIVAWLIVWWMAISQYLAERWVDSLVVSFIILIIVSNRLTTMKIEAIKCQK